MDAMKWRAVKWAALLLIGAAVVFSVWKWPEWRAAAQAGSAYAARITCSCRYIQGRSAESCARDIEEDASLVSISDNPDDKMVTGSIPLLGKASARFRPGYGCLMQP